MEDPVYEPDFNLLIDHETENSHTNDPVLGGVAGGTLTLMVQYYQTVNDKKTYTIKGTNPGQVAIEQLLKDSMSRQIACQRVGISNSTQRESKE